MIAYKNIPTKQQWLQDSSVTFAIRNKDIILTDVDKLIHWYHERPKVRDLIACDLFFSLDYWLKIYRDNKQIDKKRFDAVFALYSCVVGELCKTFSCTVNVLPREMELMFGRELSSGGVKTDGDGQGVRYLSKVELRQHRILFKGGKAYQFPWWKGSPNTKLRLADSKHAYDPGAAVRSSEMGQDYGFFVMTMARELYMAKHEITTQNRMFHSSYLNGSPTMAAGSMLIVNGKIKGIQANSGHYQPHDNNMLALLQALRMFAVPLGEVQMISFDGKNKVNALEFIKKSSIWSDFLVRRNRTVDSNKAAFRAKQGLGLVAQPQNLYSQTPSTLV